MELINKIRSEIHANLKKDRILHTEGVVKSAISLAKSNGVDIYDAEIAALMHDYAKNMSKEEMQIYMNKKQKNIDPMIFESKNLLHGPVAMEIAKDRFHIQNIDILNAIEFHTTGRFGMSKLEIIIALADYIEENRNFPGVEEIRKEAEKNIYSGLISGIQNTLNFLLEKESNIHPHTVDAWNYLIQSRKE